MAKIDRLMRHIQREVLSYVPNEKDKARVMQLFGDISDLVCAYYVQKDKMRLCQISRDKIIEEMGKLRQEMNCYRQLMKPVKKLDVKFITQARADLIAEGLKI